jgi:proline iminopeptidase
VPSVAANGLTLEYESLGEAANPAIVLVMGLGVQMILWPDDFCAMLVERGFRVVRFDNRDAGLSTKLDPLGVPRIGLEAVKYALHLPLKAPYLIEDMVRDTLGLLDALGLARAHVVGASMGGMIAQNLAAAAPERVASLTSIMSTTGRRSLPQPTWRARRAILRKPPRTGDFDGAVRFLMETLRTIASRSIPVDEAWLHEVCERHVRRGFHPAGTARQLVAVAASGDRTRVVSAIKVPTLVLHGDEDPLLPMAHGLETARVMRDAGGRVQFALLEGMGHDLPTPLRPRIADAIAAHCRSALR